MRAFVLSGGGNMGPTQVGALRALLERGIYPDMLIGCSAGSLNATYLSLDISLAQIEKLAEVWLSVTKHDIYPGGQMSAIWRLFTGKDSLYDNRNFYAFLQRQGVTPAHTFDGITQTKLYITATRLHTGSLHVFGDNPNDRLLDAMMASTALTPMHPPYEINGERYVDGGTVTPLPLRVAMEKGATEIYALHILDGDLERNDIEERGKQLIRGVTGVLNHSVSTMLRLQAQHDLLLAEVKGKAKLHYIPLNVVDRPAALDFMQAQKMIDFGYVAASEYFERLNAGTSVPEPVAPGLRHKLQTVVTRLWAHKVALQTSPVLSSIRLSTGKGVSDH